MNIKRKTETLRSLISKRDDLNEEIASLRNEIRAELGLGSHDGVTVYSVKETRVKSHWRRGFKAVRVKR